MRMSSTIARYNGTEKRNQKQSVTYMEFAALLDVALRVGKLETV